jgi:hypothetical protein
MSDNAKWIIGTVFVAIVTFLSGTLVSQCFLKPDLVYGDFTSKTILGPKLTGELGALFGRQEMEAMAEAGLSVVHAKGADRKKVIAAVKSGAGYQSPGPRPNGAGQPSPSRAAGASMALLSLIGKEAILRLCQPGKLFPESYYRLQVANRGRRAAHNVGITVRVPGVMVEHRLSCDTRPDLAARPLKVFEDRIPDGLSIPRAALPTLAPGESLTLEIWYSDGSKIGSDIGWPKVTEANVVSDEGMARRETSPAPTSTPVAVAAVVAASAGFIVGVLSAVLLLAQTVGRARGLHTGTRP